jgi:ribosomal protein S27E
MTIVEKAAYLKGLVDGIGFEPSSDEGKLWTAVGDVLLDLAHEIEDLQAANEDHAEALDDLSEELGYLEDTVYDLDDPSDYEKLEDYDDDDYADCSSSCGSCCGYCGANSDEGDESGDDGEVVEDALAEDGDPVPDVLGIELNDDGEIEEYNGVIYDVVCPICGEEISFDEDTLNEGSIKCPSCGETLEFDLSEDEQQ